MRFGVKEDYKSLCLKLAKKGFVIIPINYRVNPNTKCLVIHGDEDDVSPLNETAEVFAKQIGDRGVIKFMEGCDHYWIGEEERLVVNTITDFLKENLTFAESTQAATAEGDFFKQIKNLETEYTLYVGEAKSASVKISLPDESDSIGKVTVTYESNNNKVAKVNSKGVITAKSKGNAIIYTKVTLENGVPSGYTF